MTIIFRKGPGWEVGGRRPGLHTLGRGGACQTDMRGDGTRRELDLRPFPSQLFAEEKEKQAEEKEKQAEGPGRLLYKDGFSTILHLLLGSPHPAARTLHAELCQAGARQGLSLCESWPPRPLAGTRSAPGTRLGGNRTGSQPVGTGRPRGKAGRNQLGRQRMSTWI